ncbi:MAG: aldo/keto reductase [Eubacteriales bacterium]|nr:aldo/keto reductase [Eubacteriales bacterium]
MRYKIFGNTGLKVSEISLGTWGIGGAGWGHTDHKQCEEAVRAMLESGVNLIDTAPAYNDGAAERFLGNILKEKRESLYYVTKTGTQYKEGVYSTDNSAKAIRRQCEESLKYLNTDYIDVYLIHWPDAKVPMEETFSEMNKLKEEGKINHIGVSNFSLEQIKEASKYSCIEVIQDQYSMVYGQKKDKIVKAHEENMAVMIYGSMGAGILSGKYRKKPVFEKGDMRTGFYQFFEEPRFTKIQGLLEKMDGMAKNHGNVPISQIALNWSIQKSYVDTAIVGVRSAGHAFENCDTTKWKLTEEELRMLDEYAAHIE